MQMASVRLLATRRVQVRGVATTLWLHLSLLLVAVVGDRWLLDSIGFAEVSVGVVYNCPPGIIFLPLATSLSSSSSWLSSTCWICRLRCTCRLLRSIPGACTLRVLACGRLHGALWLELEVYMLAVFCREGDAGHLG